MDGRKEDADIKSETNLQLEMSFGSFYELGRMDDGE